MQWSREPQIVVLVLDVLDCRDCLQVVVVIVEAVPFSFRDRKYRVCTTYSI